MSEAPTKTCECCGKVGVMPTFMSGATMCYDCLGISVRLSQVESVRNVHRVQRLEEKMRHLASLALRLCKKIEEPVDGWGKISTCPAAEETKAFLLEAGLAYAQPGAEKPTLSARQFLDDESSYALVLALNTEQHAHSRPMVTWQNGTITIPRELPSGDLVLRRGDWVDIGDDGEFFLAAPAEQDATGRLINAAEKHAESYDGDERPLIKTDVINAFYAGAKFKTEDAKNNG